MGGRLEGKVALVTGSGRGQGEAEARLFVEEGAHVVVSDIDRDAAEAVASSIGDRAIAISLDVTDAEAWSAAIISATTRFGGLDILVNNAGIGIPPRLIEEETTQEHRLVIDINLHGVWLGMRAAIPAMTERGGGSIVNISSIDGLVGVAGMTSYTASKFAVTGMTKSVALEVGRRGIRVNSIHPGVIETPMVALAPPEVHVRLGEILDRQAIPRMGTPKEVAYLALFLASDESSYCTGSSFVIDGGHIAGPYRDEFTH